MITLLLATDEGAVPGEGLGTALTLLIFVGIPVAVFLIIGLLVYGPGLLRRPRYRPGRTEWDYAPIWVGGPDPDTTSGTPAPHGRAGLRGGGAGAGW